MDFLWSFEGNGHSMKIKKIDIRDIDGFIIGNAEDVNGGTGCTVIISEDGAVGGVDVRGGGPATRETDLLKSENIVETVNAVVLSGGSAFGLEAASGVMRALAQKGIGFRTPFGSVPIVTGASLFDLAVGRSDVYPDREMGIEAVENAYQGIFDTGNHGAGTGATCGKMLGMDRAMKTGLGTFACGDDLVQVGAVVAVNACADVYNGAGNIIAGLRTTDGTAIQGTIKVLKDMLYPESGPEISFEDIKVKTEEEQPIAEVITVSPAEKTSEAPADTKSDIARAIQEAYDLAAAKEAAEAQMEDPTPAEVPEEVQVSEVTDEPAVTEPANEEPVIEEPAEEVQTEAEPVKEEAPIETTVAEVQAEAEPVIEEPMKETPVDTAPEIEQAAIEEPVVEEPAAETVPVTPEVPEVPAEPEPEVKDPYELSEEEKLDMGYDISFNTTIGCLITNAKLTKSQANKLASILHDAYARAIKPVHSTMDGDTIFVLSTNKQEVNFDAFAALATDVMQYAIIDGAQMAEGAYGLPSARDMIRK